MESSWRTKEKLSSDFFRYLVDVSSYLVDGGPGDAPLPLHQVDPLLHGHLVRLEAERGGAELGLHPRLPLSTPPHLRCFHSEEFEQKAIPPPFPCSHPPPAMLEDSQIAPLSLSQSPFRSTFCRAGAECDFWWLWAFGSRNTVCRPHPAALQPRLALWGRVGAERITLRRWALGAPVDLVEEFYSRSVPIYPSYGPLLLFFPMIHVGRAQFTGLSFMFYGLLGVSSFSAIALTCLQYLRRLVPKQIHCLLHSSPAML